MAKIQYGVKPHIFTYAENRHCLRSLNFDADDMKKTAAMKTVAILWKKSLLLTECHTTSRLFLGRHAPNHRRAKQLVCLVAFKFALEDEVCGELGQILDYNRSQIFLAS